MAGRGNFQVGQFNSPQPDGCTKYETMMVADTTQATIYDYFDLDVIRSQGHTSLPGEIPHGTRD